jgi:GLPGLI family protein
MQRFFTLTTGIILLASAAKAQQPDAALLLVHYKFSHVRDTTDRANPYKEDMVLVIGQHAGVYRSYTRQLENVQVKKQMSEQAGGPVRIHFTGSGSEYFQYPNDHKLIRKENLFGNVLVAGPLPVINWQITADTATYGDLHCQKATGHFKGRDYIAWFCPDLPLHVGPWELTGLPGVIVEAYDTKKDIQFLFDGIEKAGPAAANATTGNPAASQGALPPLPGLEDLDADPNLIQLPANATKITDKEFAKLQAAFHKDPNGFAQSMMAAHNSGMAGDNGPKMKMDLKSAPAPVNNNPIELPDNQ